MREAFFAFLETRPEFEDPGRCAKKLVGKMRRHLIERSGADILEAHSHVPERAKALIREREVAMTDLAEFCARCGRCDWGLVP